VIAHLLSDISVDVAPEQVEGREPYSTEGVEHSGCKRENKHA
jgi:hypothetical protein